MFSPEKTVLSFGWELDYAAIAFFPLQNVLLPKYERRDPHQFPTECKKHQLMGQTDYEALNVTFYDMLGLVIGRATCFWTMATWQLISGA